MRTALLVVALASSVYAQPLAPAGTGVRYDGQKVVRATIRSQQDMDTMLSLSPDMWSHHVEVGGEADFQMLPGDMAALQASGVPFRVLIDDIQRNVDAERTRLAAPAAGHADGPFFTDFKTYAQVNDYLTTLHDLRPDLTEVFTIGTSLEGRAMRAIRIRGSSAGPDTCKPMILLTGTQHAREWIATMVSTYLADRFVRQYDTDPAVKAVVDSADIVIVPIVNPDGFEYTWTNNRYWRKNRRPNAGGSFGVDTNRNWGYKWGVILPHANAGNNDPNSDVYWGTAAFSEPETAAIRDYALSKPQIRWQHDIHSYGQWILYPW
jgi:murein tripeptide amidase MpaA